jgi:AcrR family transcriptional regulator
VTAVATEPSTRERLIAAAEEVFLEQGYDGTRLQDVARRAGLTTGAVYSNFRGKSELLFEAIGARGAREVDELLTAVPSSSLPAALRVLGRQVVARDDRPLLVDAVTAARRDPDLADHLRERFEERESWFASLITEAAAAGAVDPSLDAEALSRFLLTVALGTLVVRTLDLPAPDSDAWGAVIDRLVASVEGTPS